MLSRRIQSKLKGLKVDLLSLFSACFNKKLLQPYCNFDFDSCKEYMSKEQHHEAGYDSFVTGCAFIGMVNFIHGIPGRINLKCVEGENKLLYSRFSGEVSINGNRYCSNAQDFDTRILIQETTKQLNPEWKEAAAVLSKFGSLIVHEDKE